MVQVLGGGVPKRALMPSAAQRAEARLPVTKNASCVTLKWGSCVQRLSRMYRVCHELQMDRSCEVSRCAIV